MMGLVPAVLAGAAGNCICECAKRGYDWLRETYRFHNPKVQENAQKFGIRIGILPGNQR